MNNRNDLTHLYPKISDRTDNMNHREKFRNISRDNFEKDTNVYRYFPTVAALITVPVTLFVMLVNLLKEDLNSLRMAVLSESDNILTEVKKRLG